VNFSAKLWLYFGALILAVFASVNKADWIRGEIVHNCSSRID